ncbi:hypothetical protein BU15DRAFT_77798 [Melanogaster broomeanus]|nr:hypothetical protein BU15DRAFT_77798 [Melanogaster broomeanus]
MSDSIPTPPQPQSTVSSEAFESLIDLLASDGIDHEPTRLHAARARAQPKAPVVLRDSSGKLDFDKVRLMFAAQNDLEGRGGPGTAQAAEKPFSEEGAHIEPKRFPMVLSRSNSRSPQRAGRRNTAHHRSSTFGDQPWSGSGSVENGRESKAETPPSVLHQPLSFHDLDTALTSARTEVKSLRQQYDNLQALVSKHLGTGTQRTNPTLPLDKVDGGDRSREDSSETRPRAASPPLPPSSDIPSEIACLTETEAKCALAVLTRTLNLTPTNISSLTDPVSIPPTPAASSSQQISLPSQHPTPQYDLTSITRALRFLSTVDELVWKRSLSSSGPNNLQPAFSEENVAALLARLELWERVVRR